MKTSCKYTLKNRAVPVFRYYICKIFVEQTTAKYKLYQVAQPNCIVLCFLSKLILKCFHKSEAKLQHKFYFVFHLRKIILKLSSTWSAAMIWIRHKHMAPTADPDPRLASLGYLRLLDGGVEPVAHGRDVQPRLPLPVPLLEELLHNPSTPLPAQRERIQNKAHTIV